MKLAPIALLFVVAACSAPEPTYHLTIASDRGGEGIALVATDLDTTFFEVLVPAGGTPYGAGWSPDGRTLAYTAQLDSIRSVFFLREGETTHPVQDGVMGASAGGFSPDGTRFLYASRSDYSAGHIMVLDIASGESTQLTFFDDYNTTPIFTADGRGMVHCRQHTETVDGEERKNGDLFLTDLDSGQSTRLTSDPAFDCIPDLAPDGRTIAYHSCGDAGCRIMLVDVDGTNVRPLVDDGVDSRWPRWSPDGEWVAYTRTEEDNSDIWLVRPDGSGKRALTTAPGRDEVAAWRPAATSGR